MRLVALRDPQQAERWQAALEAQSIDAHVEIDDAHRALPGQMLIPGVSADSPVMFVYVISVPVADRERAASVLIDLGWDGSAAGRQGEPIPMRTVVRGGLVALALGAAALALRIAIG